MGLLNLVPIDEVVTVWPLLQPFYERLDGAFESHFRLLNDAIGRKLDLGYITDDHDEIVGAFTVQLKVYPTHRRTLKVDNAAGTFSDDWRDVLEQLETYAISRGCTHLEMVGRPGWEKMWQDYKRKSVTLIKEL